MTNKPDYSGAIVEAREALKAFISDKSDGLDAGVYETEYDGRTYTLCMYCKYQEYGQNWGHEHNCLINRSKATLAKLDALIEVVQDVVPDAVAARSAILHEAMKGGE